MKEDKTNPEKVEQQKDNQLFSRISELIEQARGRVASVVNLTMVHTYFEVGRMIIDNEQQGKERAEYGKSVLKELSTRLTAKFGKGFSVDNLQNMRRFYNVYSIYETPSSILIDTKKQSNLIVKNASNQVPNFTLGWSHYLILMRIENPSERRFDEFESE